MVRVMDSEKRDVINFLTGKGSLGVTIILGLLAVGLLVSVVTGLLS